MFFFSKWRSAVILNSFTEVKFWRICVFGTSFLLAHSKNELIQWRDVRRLSVRPSVNFCANRFFSQANGRIATKLAQDGLRVSVHPGWAQGQGQGQRSRDTRTFLDSWNELIRHWRSGFSLWAKFCVNMCNSDWVMAKVNFQNGRWPPYWIYGKRKSHR